MKPISVMSIKDALSKLINFSDVPTCNNLDCMINTWINNRELIERAFDKQPGKRFNVGEYTVNFNGINSHVTYNSIGECRLYVFPCERHVLGNYDVPWYKLYNRTSYDGVITNQSVYIMDYNEFHNNEVYSHVYNMFIDIFTFIIRDSFTTKFNVLVSNALVYKHEWYSINGGAFYAYGTSPIPSQLTYYNFSNWSKMTFDYIIEHYNIDDIADIQPCEDPREEHWEHFIRIDHQLELNAQTRVANYVSEVFDKIRNHETLPIEARVALIHDIRSVDNFNKIRTRYKLHTKHFSTDKLQKAIDKERKNIDNIIFGLYTGKL